MYTEPSISKDAKWFDNDCRQAKYQYLQALKTFNYCKSQVTENYCVIVRKVIKNLISRRKKTFENKKLAEIEKLKLARPHQLCKYFKKKNKNESNDISAEEFYQYFEI